jgi:hypothetical protein
MVSQGHKKENKSNMPECQSDCKSDSHCHLFEWDHNLKICRFIMEPSSGKFNITKASDVLIGISKCENIDEMWLKMNYVKIADPADQTGNKSSDKKLSTSIE